MAPINTAKSPQDGYDPVRDGELRVELWMNNDGMTFRPDPICPGFEAKVSLGPDAPDHALDWGVHYNHFLGEWQLSVYCDDIEADLSGMVLYSHRDRADALDGRQPGGPRTSDQVNPARPFIPYEYVIGELPSGTLGHDPRSIDTAAADLESATLDAPAPHEQFPDLLAQLQSCFATIDKESTPVIPSTVIIKDDSGKSWAYQFRQPETQTPVVQNTPGGPGLQRLEAMELGLQQGMLIGCPASFPTLS